MLISVVIPTHNPDPTRLRAVLGGLRAQTLPTGQWETIIVDNASTDGPDSRLLSTAAPANTATIHEPTLGLAHARRCGLRAAGADIVVFVDDDNVLAPDFLTEAVAFLARHSNVGLAGGKVLPSFVEEPPAWTREFFPLLGLRDLGANELMSTGLQPSGSRGLNRYPDCAPIGAGMVLRRAAWRAWLEATNDHLFLSDRRGDELSSAGDNEIVLSAMKSGWEVAYAPQLRITHLIPSKRLQRTYLARLNRSIQRSWIQVLMMNDACPWSPISRPGAALRKLKAFCRHRAWQSDAAYVRWQGACGHFDGRADGGATPSRR